MKITPKLYKDFSGLIRHLCQVRTRATDNWEEAYQEVWLQIHRAKEWEEFNYVKVHSRSTGSLVAYIKKIANNTISYWLRDDRIQKMKGTPKSVRVGFASLDAPVHTSDNDGELTLGECIADKSVYVDMEDGLDYYKFRSIGRDVLKAIDFNILFQPESVETETRGKRHYRYNRAVALLKEHIDDYYI